MDRATRHAARRRLVRPTTSALVALAWAVLMGVHCDTSPVCPWRDAEGICHPWTDCEPGSFVAVEGTAGADRVCQPCPVGTFSATFNAPVCQVMSHCAPGEQVVGTTSATADRRCRGCDSGTYSAVEDAPACVPWQTCPAGTFVATLPSAQEDRICAACEPGTYADTDNQSACLPLEACPAGTEQEAPGTPASSTVCRPCQPGWFCPGGEAAGAPCLEGTWDHDGAASTACAPQTTCSPGYAVAAEGTPTSDRACAPCEPGSFADTTNAPACTAWTECQAGQWTVVPGTNVRDRACEPCGPGTFSTAPNAPACDPWTPCPEGAYVTTAGTATSDQVCTPCTGGLVCAGACIQSAQCCAALGCDDGDPCTIDACGPTWQCTHAPAPDGFRPDATRICCGGVARAGNCCTVAQCGPASRCTGTAATCAAMGDVAMNNDWNDAYCTQHAGCSLGSCRYWGCVGPSDCYVHWCNGTATACSALSVAACAAQAGCSVQANACTANRCTW